MPPNKLPNTTIASRTTQPINKGRPNVDRSTVTVSPAGRLISIIVISPSEQERHGIADYNPLCKDEHPIIISSLQDFTLARCARIGGELYYYHSIRARERPRLIFISGSVFMGLGKQTCKSLSRTTTQKRI